MKDRKFQGFSNVYAYLSEIPVRKLAQIASLKCHSKVFNQTLAENRRIYQEINAKENNLKDTAVRCP